MKKKEVLAKEKQKKKEHERHINEIISKVNKAIKESMSCGSSYAYYNGGAWFDFDRESARTIYYYFVRRGFKCDIGYCAGGYVKVAWGTYDIDKDPYRSYVLDE